MKRNESARQREQANKEEDFLEPSKKWSRLFAECWGTFLLVLAGAGAHLSRAYTGEVSMAMEATAPGLVVMAVIYFMGTVSGAHLNPAVTLAFTLRRHFPWKQVPSYLLSQFTGGIAAILLLKLIFGDLADLGATSPHIGLENWKAFVIEMVLTAGLINTILGTASGPRNVGTNGALAVGGYIVLAGLWAGALTGASMNPVRSLAPDIVRGDFQTSWIYVGGTLTGAILGVCFEWILKGRPSHNATLEAQGAGTKDESEK